MYVYVYVYIISQNLSAKYYQENEDCKKKLVKDIKIFLKKKNKKSESMIVNVTKISQKLKNKSFLSIEKKYYRMRKIVLL